MKKLVLSLIAVLAIAGSGFARADQQAGLVNLVIAPPGASITGVMTDANIVLPAPSTFLSLDIAPHNVVSDAVGCHQVPDPNHPGKTITVCDHGAGYYFDSAIVTGGVSPIVFTSHAVVGATYTFHCFVHSNMTGTLTIVA